jgi:hypothetical protein
MIEFVIYPVGNGPVGEQRGKTAAACIIQGVIAMDIEVGFLLACKRCRGQIFSSG